MDPARVLCFSIVECEARFMKDSQSKGLQFLAELKRRRVFRVMAVYGGVAFLVLQVADLTFEPLGLPGWTMTFVVLLAVLGFPVAIVLSWAFEMTPAGVRKTENASSEEIEAIIAQPASKRWLSGLLALAGIGALVLTAWWVGRETASGAGAEAEADAPPAAMRIALSESEDDTRPSIAVLPFLDMSPEGDQEYFSDGITEEILNTLAKIRELKVAARTSAFAFRGRDLDMRAIGDSLGVAYLIEGSVRKADNRLRITAQLIDAADGTHLWSESYDRTMDDVFAIQEEIATSIADELRVPLGLDDPAELVTPTADMQAYDLYLTARARMRERGESLREAIRLFEAAIARDSTWAPAWAGLAGALEVTGWSSNRAAWEDVPTDPAEWRSISDEYWGRSEQAARRALELDPENASAHVALGSILRNRQQWDASETAYLRALATDPDNAEVYQQYAHLLGYLGRETESVRAARRAVGLDPASVRSATLAMALLYAGQDEEALEVIEEGARFVSAGQSDGALAQVEFQVLVDSRRFEELRPLLIGAGGPPEFADLLIGVLEARSPDGLPPEARDQMLSDPMLVLLLAGPDRAAAALLETARTDPLSALQVVWMPMFDPIRDRPAYLEALRVLNLEGRTPLRAGP
jgi:TolB-like protein